ncbi:hypothetical protein E2974_18720 [Paracoccus yeei]|uniref:hypothetical protein n=1 Tax=Paracoccus yeei TaxID=147645 RepID=UPI003BF8F288
MDNGKATTRKSSAKKNAVAYALHEHMTNKFHKRFSCKGTIECQSFLNALFEEVYQHADAVPPVFRRALTNKVDAKGKGAHMLSTFFGAFCREKRGLWMFFIFDKNPTYGQLQQWKALEEAARAKDTYINDYISYNMSCVQWLMNGFVFGNDPVIDDEDLSLDDSNDDAGSNESNKEFEIIPFERKTPEEQAPKTVKDVVYEYIIENENRGTTGRVTIIPSMVKLRGFDRNEVEQALLELQSDGLIMLDELSSQYRTIKRAA